MSEIQDISLTSKQHEIVYTRTPRVVIEAQPGSGKTRILVERLVAGVQKEGLKPQQLVAITFTEKAAQEIKDRVMARIQHLSKQTMPQQAVDQLWISTIHGFCRRILKEHAWEVGLSTTFSVLSSEQAFFLKNKVFKQTFQALLHKKDPALSFLLTEYGFYKLKSLMMGLYEKRFELRSMQRTPCPSDALLDPLFSVFHILESEVQAQKREKNVCDFEDLLWNCFDLLNSQPLILKQYRKQFALILVDEFQDTNEVQRLIMDLLTQKPAGPSLMVVGDPKQSIYRFRGADVSLFYEVKKDILEHEGFCFELLENFRSHKTLIEFTNTLFRPLLGEAFIASEPARVDPPKMSFIEYWTPQKNEEVLSSEEGRKKEATWLASHLKKQGKEVWSQTAILFRAMTFSPLYEEALDGAKIPWVRTDGGALYQSPEFLELVSLLKWVLNPQDDFSLWTVLLAPWSGLSLKTLGILAQARAHHRSSLEALLKRWEDLSLSDREGKKIQRFLFILQKLRWTKERVSLEAWYRMIVSDTLGSSTLRVRRFLRLIREFEDQNPDFEWQEFLQYMEALQEEEVVASEPLEEAAQEGGVRLLTIHQAKGLEFDRVYLPDLGYLPRRDSPLLLIDKKIGIGLKEDSIYTEIKKKERECEEEESKRLFYVSVTRAKNKLVLSTGNPKPRAGSWASFIEKSKSELKSVMLEEFFS